MYIYILLKICTVTAYVNDRGLWNVFKDIVTVSRDTYAPEDARLNITQLAEKYKYDFEEHTVVTKDGYIINFHRIPQRDARVYRPVVFLMHGILESSDSWLLMGPGKALAYVLADQGFDVWMGNTRGNKHALRHATLNFTMPTFWEFSWEEIAMYDLPAMIDYILERTGQRNLHYIGHSQGTTSGYVMCSMRPEYNAKIKIMFSLAPEAWMGNVRSLLVRMFSPTYNLLGYLLREFNLYSGGIELFNKLSAFVCSSLAQSCDNIMYMLIGYETKTDVNLLSVIFGHMPTGASLFQFVHYGQLVQSKRFQRYDYGSDKNMAKYGQNTPPDYDLSKITAPQVIFYSEKDWLSDPSDVDTLRRHLPNVYDYINLHDFTHLDYVYASEAVPVIYHKIIDYIRHYEEIHNYGQPALNKMLM